MNRSTNRQGAFRRRGVHVRALLLATAASIVSFTIAEAQSPRHTFNIPSQDAVTALQTFAKQAGKQVLFPFDAASGHQTPAISGDLEDASVLNRLADAAGLTIVADDGHTITLRKRVQGVGAQSEAADRVDEVVVTGTHIAGIRLSSPIVVTTQQQIIEEGQFDLGQFARSIPENYGGGASPAIGFGGGNSNVNFNATGASSFDLRGLGPDATLTLVNGRRLAYDSLSQSVDVSQIPLEAVQRVDVLLDGASAVYGSDAVAGVVNVVLKPDFDGLTVSSRVGGATGGGDEQQEYGLVDGKKWDGGGFMVAYDYNHGQDVLASQRALTSRLEPNSTLYPGIIESSVLMTGHQDLTNYAHFSIDADYTYRSNKTALGELPSYFETRDTTDHSYFVSPTLTIDLPKSWTATLNADFSADNAHTDIAEFNTSGVQTYNNPFCLCNGMQSVEADGSGPLFSLPAGDIKAALGVGYRREAFTERFLGAAQASTSYSGETSSTYGFGEFQVPILSPAQAFTGIHRLDLNFAFRYEDYDTYGGAFKPKVGLLWAPTPDLDVKASWGQSFKVPTLSQQYTQATAELLPADDFGRTNLPASANSLFLLGGNTHLKPEEATTETVGVVFHPAGVSGLNVSLNYFHIDYTNRIIQPLANLSGAVINPNYAQFITNNPSASLLNSYIATVPTANYYNYTGAPYNPANVLVLLDDEYVNAARQVYDGVDARVSYSSRLAGGLATLSGSASWLQGSQQSSSTSPAFDIVGTSYYPTRWRARATGVWKRDGLSLSASINYTAGETNTSTAPVTTVASQITTDLAVGYKFQNPSGPLKGLTCMLALTNLFDAPAPYMTPGNKYIYDYDPTNYSALGRVINLSISKHF